MQNTFRKRYTARYNRYKPVRNNQKDYDFVQNVMKQVIACIVIFVLIFILKNVNSSVTNSLTGSIKSMLTYTMDMNKTAKSVVTFANNIMPENATKNTGQDPKTNSEMQSLNDRSMNNDVNIQQDNSVKNDLQEIIESNNNVSNDELLELDSGQNIEVEKSSIIITQDIVPPLNGVITSKFGIRKHPLSHKELFHYGIDIDGENGDDIVAAMSGEVLEVGNTDIYGKYLRLKHEDDIITFYAHCSEINIEKGEQVTRGHPIAKVGDLGAVSGSHLHFEIWKKDKVLDPMRYIDLPLDTDMLED